MIAGLQEQFQNVPKAQAALAKIGPNSPLYWQARLRSAALDAQDDRFDQAVRKLRTLVAEKADRIDAALTLCRPVADQGTLFRRRLRLRYCCVAAERRSKSAIGRSSSAAASCWSGSSSGPRPRPT
jgi:hypothetical protein